MRAAGAIALALVASDASAAEPRAKHEWAVLPVQGETTPPRDPTLLRLTREIGEAIHGAVGGAVHVVSREMRDDACPASDAVCPRDVCALVGAQYVVSLALKSDLSELTVRVYGRAAGLKRSGALPCGWSAGLASCKTEGLAEILAAAPPQAQAAAPKPADPGAVAASFAKLEKRLAKCARLEGGAANEAARVEFRVDARGRATNVHVVPRSGAAAHACMARVVESLRVPASSGPHPDLQSFPLPGATTAVK